MRQSQKMEKCTNKTIARTGKGMRGKVGVDGGVNCVADAASGRARLEAEWCLAAQVDAAHARS